MLKEIIAALIALFKGVFGMDKPEDVTVEHPKPDIEVGDGKTDKERLKDLDI
jgi:hypothetical protein